MDISNALIAKSDQLNAIDIIAAPVTVTFTSVTGSESEQPVSIVTDVFGTKRPFKPSKTVLRVLAAAWGVETREWVGRRATLYRDPAVRWAGEEVGGIRIQALSDISKPMHFNLPTSKGKHAKSTVAVLPTATPARDFLAELELAGNDLDALTALGKAAATNNAPADILNAIRGAYQNAKNGAQ